MKFEFSGTKKVFSFTFTNQIKAKSFKILTIILAVLFFALPAAIMPLIEIFGDNEETSTGLLDTVYIADNASLSDVDFSMLNYFGEDYNDINYIYCKEGIEEAKKLSDNTDKSLIMLLEKEETVSVNLLLPENSLLNDSDISEYGYFVSSSITYLLLLESGASLESVISMLEKVSLENEEEIIPSPEEIQAMQIESFKETASMLLPYINIMVLYFMILSYGQSVANSLVLEKSSKLMEFFLLSVKPGAIILGKILGIAGCAITQFSAWILSAVAGFASGTIIVKALNPDTDMILIKIFDAVSEYADLFSIPGLLLGILIIFAGFFLYCTIAAIGGAIAQKAEDLASTNSIFVLILIVSFFATFNFGGEDIMAYSELFNYIPFTAILVTPSHLILGNASLITGCVSLALIVITIFVFAFIAGKLYKSMVFYKGNIPKPKQLISFIKSK